MGALCLDTEESMEVDDAAEFTEPLDAVRVSVRDESLDCVDVEGSGAGVREVGSTDLLLILFFEVDTGIMEAEVPGSRDLPGVWNAWAVDLSLTGEEGLDLACELAVGRAKPIDFRGFGVTGIDEGAKKVNPSIKSSPETKIKYYTRVHVVLSILLLLHLPHFLTVYLRLSRQVCRTLLLLLQHFSLSALCSR